MAWMPERPAVSAAPYTKDNPLKVVLVVHGTLGDKSFFDSAAAGLPPTTAPKLADTLKSKWARGCLAASVRPSRFGERGPRRRGPANQGAALRTACESDPA